MRKGLVVALLALVVAASFLVGLWFGGGRTKGSGGGDRKVLYYVDPMNPGFRLDKPGIAPCGMPLEPVYADAEARNTDPTKEPVNPGALRIGGEKQRALGIQTTSVEKKHFTHIVRLLGRVVADETLTYRINTAVDSWVRRLSDATTGSVVKQEEVLAELLSPLFFNAQQTYLTTLDNLDRIKKQLGGELRSQQSLLSDNQYRLSIQGLQTLGITDAQIMELEKTRTPKPFLELRSPTNGVVLARNISLNQWFRAGEELYRIADIRRVWVYADVYEEEVKHLRPGTSVKLTQPQMNKTFSARVSEVLPLFDPSSKTLKVRFDVANPNYDLRPGMFVDVEVPITLPPAMTVPVDALIDTGVRKVIYVDRGDGYFEPRRVETGWRLGNRVEISGGLMPGDRVVTSGTFLIDSESRLRVAALGIRSEGAKDPVCGMYVDEERAKTAGKYSQDKGQSYFFCSPECKKEFDKDPKKYAGKAAGQQARMPAADRHGGDDAHAKGELVKRGKGPGSEGHDMAAKGNGMMKPLGAPKEMKPSQEMSEYAGSKYFGIKPTLRDKPPKNEPVVPADTGSDSKSEGQEDDGPSVAPPSGTRLK